MTNDLNDPILRGLFRELGILQQQIDTINEAVKNRKYELTPKEATDANYIPVLRDEYKGIKTSDALENYLAKRGGVVKGSERIAEDLVIAGVKVTTSPSRKPQQNLMITLTAPGNHKRFAYDEATDTVSLVRATTPKPPARAR